MKQLTRVILLALMASCGGDGDPKFSEVCDTIGLAFCNRAAACSNGGSSNECFQAFKPACCAGDQCNRPYPGGSALIDRCEPALSTAPCGEISRSVLPAACVTSK